MITLKYKGTNIYTQANKAVTTQALTRAEVGIGTICDAYLFSIGPERQVKRAAFDRAKIEACKIGLMVDVQSQIAGKASVAIAGLDSITQFLYDTAVIGRDLSTLKGREVTEYYAGPMLLGIGIKK